MSEPKDSLDAAWAEAEAALPEGWHLRVEELAVGYIAEMTYPPRFEGGVFLRSEHPTPAAALRALVRNLRERP